MWLVGFVLAALFLTYPLPGRLLTHIPQGSEGVGTVPFFNLWSLQWNLDQLLAGYPSYWDAPIFAPQPGTFAFSEPQLVSGLLAAPVWLATQSPALAYNFLVLLFLTLNGWFAAALLRGWGVSPLAAFLGGLLMQGLPFIAQEMGVLQLIALFGLLWSLFFLNRLLAEPRPIWRTAIGLALGTPLTFFTCSYYGLFSLFFLPLAFGVGWRRRHSNAAFLERLLGAALLAGLLTGPFLGSQQQQLASLNVSRSAATIEANSARLADYAAVPDHNLLYRQLLGLTSSQGQRLFPGFGLLLLAGVGLLTGTQFRAKPYLLLALLLAFFLSFGLRLNLGGWQPYQGLREIVPGLAELRSPFRFAVLVQLHLALLAGLGLHQIQQWRGWWLAVAVAGLILVEGLVWPLPLQGVPNLAQPAPWQSWLNQHAPGARLVLLPFAEKSGVAYFEPTTRWMLANRHLNGTMLNGYSGFFPPDHAALRQQMLAFPTADSLALLRQKEVDYVVVFETSPNAPDPVQVADILPLVYRDKTARVAIYALRE